jgi:hypothetical protein
LQDLRAVIARELELHRQIHSVIWAAVAAMERWSSGVARWQAKVTRDVNGWLDSNAALLAAAAGPNAPGSGVVRIPTPQQFEELYGRAMRETRTGGVGFLASPLQLQEQQHEFGVSVVVRAGAGGVQPGDGSASAAAARLRMEPELADASAAAGYSNGSISSAAAAAAEAGPGSSAGGGKWASSTGTRRVSNVSINVRQPELQQPQQQLQPTGRHALGDSAGSPVTPEGISIHSSVAAALTPGGQRRSSAVSPVPGAFVGSSSNGAGVVAGSSSRPRCASHSNKIVPVMGAPSAAAVARDAAAAGSSDSTPRSAAAWDVEDEATSAAGFAATGVSGAEGDLDGMLPDASNCGDGDDGGAAAAVGGLVGEGVGDSDDAAVMSAGRLATISDKIPHQHLRPLG